MRARCEVRAFTCRLRSPRDPLIASDFFRSGHRGCRNGVLLRSTFRTKMYFRPKARSGGLQVLETASTARFLKGSSSRSSAGSSPDQERLRGGGRILFPQQCREHSGSREAAWRRWQSVTAPPFGAHTAGELFDATARAEAGRIRGHQIWAPRLTTSRLASHRRRATLRRGWCRVKSQAQAPCSRRKGGGERNQAVLSNFFFPPTLSKQQIPSPLVRG